MLGYRLAMLVSGGLALILADQWLGWPATYRVMAVLMGIAAAAVAIFLSFRFSVLADLPNATGVTLYVLGMLVSAFAVRAILGGVS